MELAFKDFFLLLALSAILFNRSGTILAILVESHQSNIPIKLE